MPAETKVGENVSRETSRIRELRLSEVDSLIPLSREFYAASRFLGEFDIEKFRQIWATLLNGDMGVILVWDDGNGPVGVIGGFVHPELYGGAILAEEMFWFTSEKRRSVGVALYRAFEAWARSRGAESIQMVHLMDSMPEKVASFYVRLGFEPIETRYSKRLAA